MDLDKDEHSVTIVEYWCRRSEKVDVLSVLTDDEFLYQSLLPQIYGSLPSFPSFC